MAEEVECGFCNGTGRITIYTSWEQAQRLIDRAHELVELGLVDHLVTVNVEGSYPAPVLVHEGESDLAAVEALLMYWPVRLSGGIEIPTNPLNGWGGNYQPIDERFYG